MLTPVCKLLLTSTMMLLLSACGGSDPTVTDTVLVYTPAQHGAAVQHAPAQAPAPKVLVSSASESDRQAEALRMVDTERAMSLEMNRRHSEQLEREARIASNARAGVVQSPGCEDTTGHEAVLCEQRVASL
ncbi:MAG: hypothetical protein V4723_14975 [Pseudomonadota bacterium]